MVINMNDEDMARLNFYNISVLNQTWKNNSFFSYETKHRPYCGICFIVSGGITYKTENRCISASAGDIVILKSGTRYRADFNMNYTQDILINFCCETFNKDTNFFDAPTDEIIVFKQRMNMKKYFFDILNYASMNGRQCMVKSALYGIWDGICNSVSENAVFIKIKQIIDSDTEFKMREPEMAEKLHVSISTLQRTFKKNYGKTVSDYRNELRILKAKELLISGNYSMEDIAEILGFYDSGHFSRCFKKQVGLSPTKYLKQYYIM